jgi:hypothetical protein
VQLELAIDLCGSTIQRVRQEGTTLMVDLDDTPEGAISLVFETATIIHQTLAFGRFEGLLSWHPARRVSWAGVIAEYICFAMESGDSFWMEAQAVRWERRI